MQHRESASAITSCFAANQIANCDQFADADNLPTFDLGRYDRGPEDRRALAMEIGAACEKVGFFMIVNHGAPSDVVRNMFDVSRRFFDLPTAKKEETPMSDDYPYGYEAKEVLLASLGGLEAGKLATYSEAARGRDLKETFSVCLGSRSGSPHESMHMPIWPRTPADMEERARAYYYEMDALFPKILHLFAIALALPEDFFADKCDKHISALRTLHYPAQEESTSGSPNQIRASAHTDYGAITLLTENGSGLQVLKKNNDWLDVVVPKDHYVVNLGDLMARWTNDKWRSTLHRVVNTTKNGPSPRRQSIAFFCNLNPDAVVDTISTCISDERPDKYEPVSAGEYLMRKHRAATQMPARPKRSPSPARGSHAEGARKCVRAI